jgi:SAM-dependent methyltransferase
MTVSDAEKRLREGPRHDPAGRDFWDARYRESFIPWDAGGTPDALHAWLVALPPARRVLIPGCGTGYEVAAFADAGHDVIAIDFSPVAVNAARAVLGPLADRVRQADFFAFDAESGFDVVYERAFLCALPRRLWADYAARMAQIVRPGGVLAGFFFFGDGDRGPPFALHEGEIDALFGADFERVADAPVNGSVPVFAGRERWQTWRRR